MLKMEMKRIFSKKINLFAIGAALILAVIFSGFAASGNRYVDASGTVSTGFSAARKLTKNQSPWAGILTEEKIAQVAAQNKQALTQYTQEELDAKYSTLLQPVNDIRSFMVSVLTPDSEYDENVLFQFADEGASDFYTTYQKNMKMMADTYGKTQKQKAYLERQYQKIKLPITYAPYTAWSTMIMYAETYAIILTIITGFICAGICAGDFQAKTEAVYFASKYGRTKAAKTKIVAGLLTTTMIYWGGMTLLSIISFSIMGVSGSSTPYQMEQPYSIYIMTYGQYYLLTVVCGYIASLFGASLAMFVAAKMHTISVAVCIPFFLYCVLPFIGRALSEYTTFFNLIPTMLVNVEAAAKVPLVFEIAGLVIRQIPLVMGIYSALAVLLLPLIYRCFSSYGRKNKAC